MEITFNAFAYVSKWKSLEDVKAGEMPTIWEFTGIDDYTQIGTAVVTVTLHSDEEIHQRQLADLKNKLEEVRAENQQRENAILLAISKLQALTFQAA